jgi:hypothetical protein
MSATITIVPALDTTVTLSDSSLTVNIVMGWTVNGQWVNEGNDLKYLLGNIGIGKTPTKALDVIGEIAATGSVTGEKNGVFAYLISSAPTTITTAGTYYPILGTFTNSPSDNFTAVASPAIRYDGNTTQYFKIEWCAAISSEDGGRTVNIAIKKNGNLLSSSIMGQYCKTGAEIFNIAGICVVELAKNDEIQLVVTSSTNLDVVTLHNFTTAMGEFFD